jgi:hypothetical protein
VDGNSAFESHLKPASTQPNATLLIPIELLRVDPVSARVVEPHGKAEVQRAGSSERVPLAPAAEVRSGDRIYTADESSVSIRLIDDSWLLLMSNSAVLMESLQGRENSGIGASSLVLEKGRAETRVAPLKSKASKYEIRTPIVQLGVRGTQFRVAIDETKPVARTEVLDGSVNAANTLGRVDVPKGFGTLAEAGKPPSPPIALLAAAKVDLIPEIIDRLPVRFKWVASPSAKGYRVQFLRSGAPPAVIAEGIFSTPEVKFGDLADGQYVLRVRGIDDNGLEGYDAERRITIKARPQPPFLESPRGGSTVRGDKPAMRWTMSEDAAHYRLQVSASEDFRSPLIDIEATQGPETTLPQALAPGDYFWRVASIRSSGDQGPFSDPNKFTLKPIPILPEKGTEAPAIDDKTLSLRWQAGEPGQIYHFQLARTPTFDPLLKDEKLTEPHIEMPRPSGRELHMRMGIIDTDGYVAPFGPVQRIVLPKQDLKPILAVDQESITLQWMVALPGQRYRVQLAREETFSRLAADKEIAAATVRLARPGAGTYFIRTQVTDSDGYIASFSDPQRIDIPYVYPTLLPAVVSGSMIRFAWSDTGDANQVRLQLARDREFRHVLLDRTTGQANVELYHPGAGNYFVRLAVIDQEEAISPFTIAQRIAVPHLAPNTDWFVLPLLP